MSAATAVRLPFVLPGPADVPRTTEPSSRSDSIGHAEPVATAALIVALRAEIVDLSQLLRRTVGHSDVAGSGPATRVDSDAAPESGVVLRLNLLGRFELFANGRPLHGSLHRRTRELLAFVALGSHRSRARDELLEAFWSRLPVRKASNNLSVVLHELRTRLMDAQTGATVGIIGERGNYEFGPAAAVAVDVERFRSRIQSARGAIRDGDIERARTALIDAAAMYRGDLLESDQYTEWLDSPRRTLAQQYEWALLWLADDAARDGDWQRVLALGLTLVERDQEGEDGHRLIINAHLGLGRRERAVRQYREYAAIRGLPDLPVGRFEASDLRELLQPGGW